MWPLVDAGALCNGKRVGRLLQLSARYPKQDRQSYLLPARSDIYRPGTSKSTLRRPDQREFGGLLREFPAAFPRTPVDCPAAPGACDTERERQTDDLAKAFRTAGSYAQLPPGSGRKSKQSLSSTRAKFLQSRSAPCAVHGSLCIATATLAQQSESGIVNAPTPARAIVRSSACSCVAALAE